MDLCNEGLVGPKEAQAVAHFAWSIVHGCTMLAGSEDSYRPNAKPAEIEDIPERAWLGVTEYSKKPKSMVR